MRGGVRECQGDAEWGCGKCSFGLVGSAKER